MTMNKLLLIITCCFPLWTFAASVSDTIPNNMTKVVENEVEAQIQLDSANRHIDVIPKQVRKINIEKQKYSAQEFKVKLENLTPKVGAFKVKPQKADPLMGNYVKAGFGNYVTPYLEAYFNSVRNEKYSYGVHYKHLSSKNGPNEYYENVIESGTGENDLDIYGRYFQGQNQWNAELNYKRLRYNFYGIDTTGNLNLPAADIVSLEPYKQLFHIFNAKIKLKHDNPKSDFTYKAKIDFHSVKDDFSAKENTFHVGTNLAYRLDELSKIGLDIDAYISNRTDAESFLRHFYQVKPAYIRKHEKYLIKGGVNVVYDNDTLGKNGIHFYPTLHVDVRVEKPHEIHAYIGIDGNLERGSYLEMIYENPYLSSNILVNNQNNTLRFYGGVKGTIKKYVSFHGELSVKNYKNFLHYINDTTLTLQNKFLSVYETGNTSVVNTDIEVMYRKNKTFGTGLKVDGNFYSLSAYENAFHRPMLRAHYLAEYKFKDKVQINADIYYISGIFAYNFKEQSSEKLKDIIDLNLRGTYFFNQKFSAFVELNNLLSKSYQLYQYYPSKKINFLVGVGYVF